MDKKQKTPNTQTLKDLFADDPDLSNATEQQDRSLRDIIEDKYIWQDGVGCVPKSMLVCKIHIAIREDGDKRIY